MLPRLATADADGSACSLFDESPDTSIEKCIPIRERLNSPCTEGSRDAWFRRRVQSHYQPSTAQLQESPKPMPRLTVPVENEKLANLERHSAPSLFL